MSTLQTSLFAHNPMYVQAVQVTEANMAEVAAWCGGTVTKTENRRGYQSANHIKLETPRPTHERQTQAFVNDWVLQVGKHFKIYNPKAFALTFYAIPEKPCGLTEYTIDGGPCVLGEGHRDEEKPFGCRSLADYKTFAKARAFQTAAV